jgi:hypothetical protein
VYSPENTSPLSNPSGSERVELYFDGQRMATCFYYFLESRAWSWPVCKQQKEVREEVATFFHPSSKRWPPVCSILAAGKPEVHCPTASYAFHHQKEAGDRIGVCGHVVKGRNGGPSRCAHQKGERCCRLTLTFCIAMNITAA